MAQRRKTVAPKRGEVYLVSFDPTVGAEVKKTRPALILQNDIGNRYSPITIVAAITSRAEEDLYPTDVLVKSPAGGLRVDSLVLLDQIRSIDKQRLIQRLGVLNEDSMDSVDRAIEISLGLVKI
ncbi:MAG: type II toxin-antitoxin system PemK/MazF family toxin [Patescibacteria group bacterium]